MKKDTEIRLYLQERRKGMTQRVAAARAGIGERTARKYEQATALPSQLKRLHDWKTRIDPFEEDWLWVVSQLERDPALQGSTLFALLCERHPDRYRPTQVRTLQRHIQQWRVLHGPDREVMFAQQHVPGERGQSDFTHMEDLAVTIADVPFPHLVHHFVLTYSNVEAVSICFSESFEALAEGIEKALWQIGGVPAQHRTDHLSAAVKNAGKTQAKDWTVRYSALMGHYGMHPTKNNVTIAHENGDVEQSHHQFKRAVDQALRVRASRDFPNREAYERFLADLVRTRKRTAKRAICRRTGGTPAAPNHPTGSLPGIAGNRQSIQHYSRESQCLLGTLSLDRHLSTAPIESRNAGRLCWQYPRLHAPSSGWQTAASYRLSPCDLVSGAQTRCIRGLPLPG